MSEFVLWLGAALFCTYCFSITIVLQQGWKKVKCIWWWILAKDAIVILDNIYGKEITNFDAVCIIVGFVYLASLSINYILNAEDFFNKFAIFAAWLIFLIILSFSALNVSTSMMYIFKIMLMLMLVIGIVMLGNLNITFKIIGAIVVYVLMIAIDVVLTTSFLYSPVDQGVEAMYQVFQRIYCLNPLTEPYDKGELISSIVDFLMCRIMDVILLGFLSTTFMEICNNSGRKKNEG